MRDGGRVGDHEPVSRPASDARNRALVDGPPLAGIGPPLVGIGTPPPGTAAPRLDRDPHHRVLGGVVAGLATHLGLAGAQSRWILRAAFVALAFAGGFGVVLYGAFWIVLPMADAAERGPRPMWAQYAAAVAAVVLLAVVITRTSPGGYFLPIVLTGLGGALVWRQASESQREAWTRLSANSLTATARGRNGVIRLMAGAAMVVAGGVLVLTRGAGIDQVASSLVVVLIVTLGFGLITGPLWMRIVGELTAERRALVRAQDRAELAARVHDSVLQTLALIQKNADAPREVARLARGQERELRTLLYGRRTATGQFAAVLHDLVAEVEDHYAIKVDAVVVGDAVLNEVLDAAVQATREALVNAAKHAGIDRIALYAEVETDEVVVYVRDRGRGFDPGAVAEDRQGLRGSITERIERHGGRVQVRSRPDAGTEVELRVPRR